LIKGWEKWIEEYRALVDKLDLSDESLPPQQANRLNYLRNLLEAGLGTKTTLSEDNRRSHLRIPVKLSLRCKTNEEESNAYTLDIGIKGMFICAPKSPPPGSRVTIFLELNDDKIALSAIVKWNRTSEEETLPQGFGVFLTTPKTDTNALKYRNLFFEKLKSAITEKLG
jgi:Tfp pilus assembly protein PilZ